MNIRIVVMSAGIYYSSSHRDDYVKVAKYMLVHNGVTPDPDPIRLENHKALYLYGADTRRQLQLPPYLQDLLIGLLRDPYYIDTTKVEVYNVNGSTWIRFYMSRDYIKTLCSRFCQAPAILSNIVLNYGTKSTHSETTKYTDSEIPIFQNDSRVWLLGYCQYLNIVPFDHQHNNIHWMKQVEDDVDRGQRCLEYLQVTDLLHYKNSRLCLYLDPSTSIMYDADSIWDCESRCLKYKLKGGVLCDEAGLGKTLSMTGLIVCDKFGERLGDSPKIKTRIKLASAGSAVDTELGDGTGAPLRLKVKARVKTPAMAPDGTTRVRATLVVCPRRLVEQWCIEVSRYTKYVRVVQIGTVVDAKKYTYSDLAQPSRPGIDLVVASYDLFNNKNYLAQDQFRLDRVHWRRVIVDEGHEVLLQASKKRVADLRISLGIFSISSDYRWVCTGTPLSNTIDSLQAIVSYLNDLGHNVLSPVLDNINDEEYARLVELIFHKNTKQQIERQITIPKHQEHVEFLTFTDTERAIYNSVDDSDTVRKLQVCTNLSVSDTDNEILGGGGVLSLDQITRAMGAHYFSKCEQAEQRLVAYGEKIDKIATDSKDKLMGLNERLDDAVADGDKDLISEIKGEISSAKASARGRTQTLTDHIAECQVEIINYKKQLQIFRSLDTDHIRKSTCPILGTKLDAGGKVAITPDGYYYSQQGIDLMYIDGRKLANCPCTRKPVDHDQLTFVNVEAQAERTDPGGTEAEADIDMERSRWGTKMAYINKKLREIIRDEPDAKIIIFSQWKRMLILMSKALKDGNINYVFCNGNVHMMSKSIRSFKTDSQTRVLLLSSDSCNSGSNLTEASYVFLIDAVNGDAEFAKAAETQAIARTCRIGQKKVVQVYRFVMKDTIEEHYFRGGRTPP